MTRKLLQPLGTPVLLNRTYQHYKGDMYTTLLESRHTETQEILISYKGTHETWCTPRSRFNDTVVNSSGETVLRFTLQDI